MGCRSEKKTVPATTLERIDCLLDLVYIGSISTLELWR